MTGATPLPRNMLSWRMQAPVILHHERSRARARTHTHTHTQTHTYSHADNPTYLKNIIVVAAFLYINYEFLVD